MISNKRDPGRLPLDHLRRAAAEGRRQLEGLPAARQLRLQHAGELHGLPAGRAAARRCYKRGMVREPEGQFEYDATQRQAAGRLLDHPDQLPVRAPGLHAGRRRRRSSPARSTPSPPTRTSGRRPSFILNYDENDGIFDHVAPPSPPRRHAARVRQRPADRRRLPRALHHRLALDGRRLGVQPAVRPHLGAAVPGEVHRRAASPTSATGGGQTFGDLTVGLPLRRRTRATPPQLPDTVNP